MPNTPAFLLPPNEIDRLHALRQQDIATAMREPVFNGFVQLVARLFNVPISLIGLVEENEVAYTANQGLPGLEGQPRVEAVCSLIVQRNGAVVLTDMSHTDQHQLTEQAYAAAWAKGLRFYAGAPLRIVDQFSFGTLCVIDRRPRTFSPDEEQCLAHLAEIVAQTIAVRHLCLIDPELGTTRWEALREILEEEIEDIHTFLRYLIARKGVSIPVSAEVLQGAQQRFHDLHQALAQYRIRHE